MEVKRPYRFRHSHGGTECGSAHSPRCASCAYFSTGLIDYRRAQVHYSKLSNVRLVRMSNTRQIHMWV